MLRENGSYTAVTCYENCYFNRTGRLRPCDLDAYSFLLSQPIVPTKVNSTLT